jgi:hypothetical protein
MDRYVPENKELVHLFQKPGVTYHRDGVTAYVIERDGICWVKGCTCPRPSQLHHAVLRKSDVQGWQPKPLRTLIDTPYCLIKLCDEHHEGPQEPSRETVADWMLAYYGFDFVRWLQYLPFTIHPLRGWIERIT